MTTPPLPGVPRYPVSRFPSRMIPLQRQRRRRPTSVRHAVYLGTHPLALLLTFWIYAGAALGIAAWVVAVLFCWLAWQAILFNVWLLLLALWLGRLAVHAVRSRRAA